VRGSLTQLVKIEANKLGFSLTGVTTPDPPPHWSTFENWLTLGRNASMDYLAADRSIQRRADPLRILPECRSILVLGMRYPSPLTVDKMNLQHPTGRIAAFACGEDYHLVLPKLLEELIVFIRSQVGYFFQYRCYTDTGPILERDLAQRAGLGWIGKNTCLIHPQQGSYFLLAEILLGIQLDIDRPFEPDRCGTCTRCIQACPTGCILPDRTLDSSRCLSFLSIEMKSSIPLELRPFMGNWVFGCDLCQLVCPWNRFATTGSKVGLLKRQVDPDPILLDELALSAQGFNIKYKNTALMRARHSRYLRNVIVALVNSGFSRDNLLVLERLMVDPDPLIKEHAAWAVERWKQ